MYFFEGLRLLYEGGVDPLRSCTSMGITSRFECRYETDRGMCSEASERWICIKFFLKKISAPEFFSTYPHFFLFTLYNDS